MGALIQLLAIGKQDVYLTGDPQISFFKMIYKKHTNFAMEIIENIFNETPNFGTQSSSTIARKGDLIKDTYLEFSLTGITLPASYINGIGNMIINKVELEIGGNIIDSQSGLYMHLINQLSLPTAKRELYEAMVGYDPAFSVLTGTQTGGTFQVPLSFWYCKDAMSSLPLIALQYHEVKIIFNFNAVDKCFLTGGGVPANSNMISPKLWVKYIYLDHEERTSFAQNTHSYLIEQVQESNSSLTETSPNYSLSDFYHPVKEIVWVLRPQSKLNNNNVLEFGTGTPSADILTDAKLTVNGNDFFETQISEFFYRMMPFQYHTGNTSTFIYVYSFSLFPEKLQPTGTLNFGRTENTILHLNTTTAAVQINVYARNYNILKIQDGMGGTLYST